ncbi:hypothetical protein T05_14374 [Trichinella murrelli]|uniref:Uncharacterized protein n=1 Tax=Trichinella murrelli TaxID=144512 RepID=A0A0V0T6W7_9BILA|nr:hypothetical protein T05_14374 [Trichinella murrelli]
MEEGGISAWSSRGLMPSRCRHSGAGASNPSGMLRGPDGAGGVPGWDTGKDRSRGGTAAESAACGQCAALEERPVGQWPWLYHVRESRPESSPGGRGLPVTMRRLRRRRLAEILGNQGAGNNAGRRHRCGWNRGDEGIGGGTPPGRGKVFGQPPLGARRACPPQQLFTRPTPAPGIRAALESARRRSLAVRFSHEAVLRRRLGGTCSGGKPAGENVVPSPPRGLPGGGQRAKMSSGV